MASLFPDMPEIKVASIPKIIARPYQVDAINAAFREWQTVDSTLIVMAGEFGRTPKITTLAGAKLPGRDHWGAVQSVFFAGGGVGSFVGSGDSSSDEVSSDSASS